jgi:DDE superfamily endonuclease
VRTGSRGDSDTLDVTPETGSKTAPVGPAWNAAQTQPADQPSAGRRSGLGASLCRHRHDATPLDEISSNVAKGAHAVVLLDRAGWHITSKLDMPENITPIFLPSRAPELNPVENVWRYLRQNWISNTVFENYHAIVDACDAWRKLTAKPETIISIGLRDWAHVGQPL